jgi:FtsP/CotA-like multicopper oxidase with cupredoxin domain
MLMSPPRPTRRAVVTGLGLSLIALARETRAETPPRDLRAFPNPRRLRPDATVDADTWSLEGRWSQGEPGPILRLRAGQELRARIRNETPMPLSLHWHGVRGPNTADGVGGLTQEPIRPGESLNTFFTPPDPGTFLIRPCVLGGSAEPAERGLAGLLIVEEASPPAVERDLALLVDDWLTAEDGALVPFDRVRDGAGRLGNWLTVSGAAPPQRIEAAPGSRVRLRFANACNARIMQLHFEGLKPFVVAVDGQPSDSFEPLRASVPFAPGTRYDVILDMPAEAGAAGTVFALIGQLRPVPLVVLAAVGEPRPALPPVAPLPPNPALPAAIKLQNAVRKDLVIRAADAGRSLPWSINGQPGSASSPLAMVKKGQPVVLALKNETPLPQPFHLHGHVFRLLHPFDDGWEPYFLDTVQVPENRTLRIAFNADNPGKWLIASTVLERFDGGLWTWFQVN